MFKLHVNDSSSGECIPVTISHLMECLSNSTTEEQLKGLLKPIFEARKDETCTSPPPATTPLELPEGVTVDCEGASHGDFTLCSHDLTCQKYYRCLGNGRKVQQSCPAGLIFDIDIDTCNYPNKATCPLTQKWFLYPWDILYLNSPFKNFFPPPNTTKIMSLSPS